MRIVTFNVQHGLTASGAVDTAALARYCAGLGADVLGLQEVDVGVPRSGRRNQAAAVAGAGEMCVAFGRACRVGVIGRYGNALLVRGSVSAVENLPLPRHGRRESRGALVATATLAHALHPRVSVAVTHLSVDRAEATAQLAAVLAALARRPPPRLLLGDLNLAPPAVAAALDGWGLTLADPAAPTYPADAPRHRIDHVAVEGLEVTAVRVLEPSPVSDHRALCVEVAQSPAAKSSTITRASSSRYWTGGDFMK